MLPKNELNQPEETTGSGSLTDNSSGISSVVFSSSIKTNNWIVDSGATSHMCNDENEFRGVIELMVNISASVVEKCKLVIVFDGDF